MKTHLEKWVIATALAVAIPTLLPIIRKTAKPFAIQSAKWTKDRWRKAQAMAIKWKHELEDIWFEAQYQRMQKNWERKPNTYIFDVD